MIVISVHVVFEFRRAAFAGGTAVWHGGAAAAAVDDVSDCGGWRHGLLSFSEGGLLFSWCINSMDVGLVWFMSCPEACLALSTFHGFQIFLNIQRIRLNVFKHEG